MTKGMQEAKRRIAEAHENNLTELDLSSLYLSELPPEITQLQNLSELYLAINQFTELPPEIIRLQKLSVLYLSGNQFTAFPPEIIQLQQLSSLYIGHNQLTELPPEFGQLQNLSSLDIAGNQLTALPPEFAQLQNLSSLDIGHNQLTALPPEFSQLQNLSSLDIAANQLTALPPEISQLQQLSSLDIAANQLTALPPEISQLQNLSSLDIAANQLTALPPEISQLQNLSSLDIRNNRLTALPPEITQLQNLSKLNIGYNQLTALPPEITQLQNLSSLDISENALTALPPEFGQLQKLFSLNIENNQLTALPPEFGQLQNLFSLNLQNNQLVKLPREILRLRHLDIRFEENFHTSSYKAINFYGNEETLQSPPAAILQQGWDAVENYFEQLESGEQDKLHEAKLIFIGEGRAGKTSLMSALMGKPFNKSQRSTEGIAINHITLPKKETGFEKDFRLNMWDFGGQEIYKDTHRFFLTKDTIYVLIIENRKNIGYDDIFYWLNGLRVFAPNAPVLLVQNKCERNIEDIAFQSYKSDFDNIVPWSNLIRTSCHAGHERTIAELRQNIVKILQDTDLPPNVGDDIPATWVDIRQELSERLDAGDVKIPYADFEALCMQKYGLKDKQSVKTLAGYFFRMGIFVHYAENPLLRDTIFLDNQWLTDAVYKVVDNDIVKAKKGRFSFADLETMYKGTVYEGQEAICIELMEEFRICYEVERNKRYICPQRLSADPIVVDEQRAEAKQPVAFKLADWQTADALHFAFDYGEFMPRGIMSDFIVAMHKAKYTCDDASLWRHGISIEYEGTRALVYEALESKHIHIYIRGSRKQIVLDRVTQEFRDIHTEMNNLEPKTKLACRCEECRESPAEAHFFKAGVILRRWYNQKQLIAICDKSDMDVSITELMGQMVTNPPTAKADVITLFQQFNTSFQTEKITLNSGLLAEIDGNDIGGSLTIQGNDVKS